MAFSCTPSNHKYKGLESQDKNNRSEKTIMSLILSIPTHPSPTTLKGSPVHVAPV
jgi:hypothetical protein